MLNEKEREKVLVKKEKSNEKEINIKQIKEE